MGLLALVGLFAPSRARTEREPCDRLLAPGAPGALRMPPPPARLSDASFSAILCARVYACLTFLPNRGGGFVCLFISGG